MNANLRVTYKDVNINSSRWETKRGKKGGRETEEEE